MKRLLSALIAFALVLSILPVNYLFAADLDYVAKIGNTEYTTLQGAIDDAGTTYTTITLYASVSENIVIDSNQDIVLDLNGFSIDVTSGTLLVLLVL